jgi:hypothetical protein
MGYNGDKKIDTRSKGVPAGTRGKGTSQTSTFVAAEPTKAHIAQLRQMYLTHEELDDALGNLVDDGYKFTIKYDTFNKATVVFLFPEDGSPNSGLILTGRGRTVSKALRQLCYKHYVMLETDWVGGGSSPADDPDDDF